MTTFLVRATEQYGEAADEPDLSPEVVALLDELFLETVPAAPRLLQLLRQRGWDGWTHIRPAVRHA
ncbi:hypothetical protein TEK04_18475 [Klenkia sp. LSe6-5]|uniref:Uncharacterized protein n=1 Tax=Klenkia sesuvii TaxID=3103137 RepID=A0ABU8DY01_9ACTN